MISIINNLRHAYIPFFTSFYVYFDLGTSNTRIGLDDRGVIYREPTYLGLNTKTREYLFFGQEAKTIVGKTPHFLTIVRPILNGILADFDAEVEFLRHAIDAAVRPHMAKFKLIKPPIHSISCTPSVATEIERKAVIESLQKSGCTQVTIVDRSLATAAGCGFDIFSHEPQLIMDLGGGLIEISVISGGGVVTQKILKTAGEQMNKLIGNYTYLKHGISLGENTCEDLKIKLLNFTSKEQTITVRGKSLETGLPKSIKFTSSDLREALISQFHHIVDATRELIEASPPEIADSIFKNGIALSGKIAGVPGIETYFLQELKIDSYVVKNYADTTIEGLIKLNKNPETIYKLALS